MDDFEQRVRAHDWAREPRDQWHAPEDAQAALLMAWRGESRARSALMDALVHDHSGSWYPVLVPALPFLGEILGQQPSTGAHAVLGFLGDAVWFPDVQLIGQDGAHLHEAALRDALWAIYPAVKAHAAAGTDCSPLADAVAAAIEERLADDSVQ